MTWSTGFRGLLLALAVLAAACGDASTTASDGAEPSGDETDTGAADAQTDAGQAAEATTSTTAATTTTAAPTTLEETTTTVAAPPLADVELTLLDAGAEPRLTLRLDIADGASEVMVLEQTQQIVQELGGEPLQDLLVSTVMTSELEAEVIEGGYRIRSTVISAGAGPDVDPTTAAAVTENLQATVGVTALATIDEFGYQLSPGELEGVEALAPEVRQLMQSGSQITTPVPTEPVGVGAVWEISQPIDLIGVVTLQTVTYTVIAIEGSVITIEVSGSQTVEPGSVFDQGGAEIEVVSWNNATTGTLMMDLQSMTPNSDSSSAATQELKIPGTDDLLAQTIDTSIVIKPG